MARKPVRAGRTTAATNKSRKPKNSFSVADLAMGTVRQEKKRSSPGESGLSLADRIQNQREQLFKAISVVECCKYASATLLDVEAPDYVVGVYDLLCDLLDTSAGELGCIAEACRKGATPL